MDKLVTLLESIGASKSLTESIVKELTEYSEKVKTQYESDFKTKMSKAKKICLEEVAKEKEALAKKVAIFLESKANSISQTATKQRAIEEAESKSILRRAKALLEGIEIKDDGTLKNYQSLEKKTERLEKALTALKEERDLAIQKVNKSNEIASKALKHCNSLEEEVRNLKNRPIVTESKKPVTEARKIGKAITETKTPLSRRLDEGRIISEKPKTLSKVDLSKVITSKQNKGFTGSDDISQIAANLE